MTPGGIPMRRMRTSETIPSGTPAAMVLNPQSDRKVIQEHEEQDDEDEDENCATDFDHAGAPLQRGQVGRGGKRLDEDTRAFDACDLTGVPCAMNSPSVRTSMRRPPMDAMPAGRKNETAVPVRP